uniref:FA complementation group C n=1 Tax=Scophthalmus maximus TaxID=52904 RepID=A0A8D3CT24_SCOMX
MTEEPSPNVQEIQFWLDKMVAWGRADSPNIQRDVSLHLRRLSSYLQQLLTHINNLISTTETMKRMPLLGQFLGRLCWIPYVTADGDATNPLHNVLFPQKVLCQLTTDEDDAAAQALMKPMGVPPNEYHLKVLRKVFSFYSCWCSCDSILAASEACVPLATCPEAAPLIDALLQRPATCVRAALSEDFLDALSCAYSRQNLSLEEQAVFSLWHHSLSSLEVAVLSLLESVCTNTGSTPQRMLQQVSQSLLCNYILCTSTVSFVTYTAAGQKNPSDPTKLVTCSAECCYLLPSSRGHHRVFEAWFLLVQCAHWVQVTVQLLGTKGPEDCGPLLWLLTFYHHPTNRGHHRALQLVRLETERPMREGSRVKRVIWPEFHLSVSRLSASSHNPGRLHRPLSNYDLTFNSHRVCLCSSFVNLLIY